MGEAAEEARVLVPGEGSAPASASRRAVSPEAVWESGSVWVSARE